MAREVAKASMREHGDAIVNMKVDVSRATPSVAHSGAARAGMIHLTRTAASRCARRRRRGDTRAGLGLGVVRAREVDYLEAEARGPMDASTRPAGVRTKDERKLSCRSPSHR